MSLHGRLRALERERPGDKCPACRWSSALSPADVVIRVRPPAVFERYTPTKVTEQPGDRCGACGRQVVVRIASPNAMALPSELSD